MSAETPSLLATTVNQKFILPALLLFSVLLHGIALAQEKFELAKVFLERNVMDKDVEVKFEAIGGKGGMKSLKVVAPDGRTVVDFTTPGSKMGMRHLSLESPEPKDDGTVQANFPAGAYVFTGVGADGAKLEARAMLSHKFPDATSFVRPQPDAKNVPLKGMQVAWKLIKGMESHVVVIEDEASGRNLKVNLSGATSVFAVPDGFLQPGIEYKLAVGTVAKDGNSSFIETGFTTAKK